MAVITFEGQLTVWDRTGRATGPPRAVPLRDPKDGRDHPHAVAFGPDGGIVVAARYGPTTWWPDGGGPVEVVPTISLNSGACALSPDGQALLAAARAETPAGGWESQLRALLPGGRVEPRGPLISGKFGVSAAAWRPDGRQLAVADSDGVMVLWDAVAGRPGPTVRLSGSPRRLVYTPDGARLLTCDFEGTARAWDTTTGAPVGRSMRHADSCLDAAVGPDGRVAAVGTSAGTLQLWELDTGRPLGGPRRHTGQVLGVGFAAGGRKVVTVADGGRGRTSDAPTAFPGTPAEVMRAAERHTGQALDDQDEVTTLSPSEWAARADK